MKTEIATKTYIFRKSHLKIVSLGKQKIYFNLFPETLREAEITDAFETKVLASGNLLLKTF